MSSESSSTWPATGAGADHRDVAEALLGESSQIAISASARGLRCDLGDEVREVWIIRCVGVGLNETIYGFLRRRKCARRPKCHQIVVVRRTRRVELHEKDVIRGRTQDEQVRVLVEHLAYLDSQAERCKRGRMIVQPIGSKVPLRRHGFGSRSGARPRSGSRCPHPLSILEGRVTPGTTRRRSRVHPRRVPLWQGSPQRHEGCPGSRLD
jgi:hypothetical protein